MNPQQNLQNPRCLVVVVVVSMLLLLCDVVVEMRAYFGHAHGQVQAECVDSKEPSLPNQGQPPTLKLLHELKSFALMEAVVGELVGGSY